MNPLKFEDYSVSQWEWSVSRDQEMGIVFVVVSKQCFRFFE